MDWFIRKKDMLYGLAWKNKKERDRMIERESDKEKAIFQKRDAFNKETTIVSIRKRVLLSVKGTSEQGIIMNKKEREKKKKKKSWAYFISRKEGQKSTC